MGKYRTPGNESEVLPNLLGLTEAGAIGLAEFEGFLKAELVLSEALRPGTRFTAAYVQRLHRLALAHLYGFAGSYRDVNLSKGDFTFPTARFLAASMQQFECDLLQKLPRQYSNVEPLLDDVATVHGELLFIHPFREGNGRTARILANLMLEQHGYERPRWELIDSAVFPRYVAAVQHSGLGNYLPMQQLMRLLYPG